MQTCALCSLLHALDLMHPAATLCLLLKPPLAERLPVKAFPTAAPIIQGVQLINNSLSSYPTVNLGPPAYKYGTICADGFKDTAARVVCRLSLSLHLPQTALRFLPAC